MPATAVFSTEILQTIKEAMHPENHAEKAHAHGMNPQDLMHVVQPSPQDWRDKWMYYILIDRFNNPSSAPRAQWNDPNYDRFQGGTFSGITQQLDYLKSLGVGAIWMNPPLKNCLWDDRTYHGYGVQDFLSIDPRFGTEDELKHLVFEAHKRGIFVVIDIVLNHVGKVFKYDTGNGMISDLAPWNAGGYPVKWLDKNGNPSYEMLPQNVNEDEGVWPKELQNDNYFRKKGSIDGNILEGDVLGMRELVTEYRTDGVFPVRDTLIKAYEFMIAKFDFDGFRIDAPQYIERDFLRTFCNAIREFAMTIGKRDFRIFGEVFNNINDYQNFVGRETIDAYGPIGIDAALDYPLSTYLQSVIKGFSSPFTLTQQLSSRQSRQRACLSSHAEASSSFVTFIDNHDMKERFLFDANSHCYDSQMTMALGALFALEGIPCVYYGTEQGLDGRGDSMNAVREALWGKQNSFDMSNPFYRELQALSRVRSAEPALRYGRQYFREISTDRNSFKFSDSIPGIVAFSRIISDEELLFVMNTDQTNEWSGYVLVDYALNKGIPDWKLSYSNIEFKDFVSKPILNDSADMIKPDGTIDKGKICFLPIQLKPMECQILKKY